MTIPLEMLAKHIYTVDNLNGFQLLELRRPRPGFISNIFPRPHPCPGFTPHVPIPVPVPVLPHPLTHSLTNAFRQA